MSEYFTFGGRTLDENDKVHTVHPSEIFETKKSVCDCCKTKSVTLCIKSDIYEYKFCKECINSLFE